MTQPQEISPDTSQLRQRKLLPPTLSTPSSRPRQPRRPRLTRTDFRAFKFFFFCVSFLIFFSFGSKRTRNYFGFDISPCNGTICTAEDVERLGVMDRFCGPYDTKRLIYIRIPKTGSTSVLHLLNKNLRMKGIYVASPLKDWNDAVPRLDVGKGGYAPGDVGKTGYTSNQNDGYYQGNRLSFFKEVAKKVVMGNPGYNYSFFEGHVFFLEWTFARDLFVNMEPKYFKFILPQSVRTYLFPVPSQELFDDIQQITFLRDPAARLNSQYYYDRLVARGQKWRNDYIDQRGNLTLEECLLNASCLEKNELQRWCSLQTEFLCGLHEDCKRPVSEKALERAKHNIKEKILFTGFVDVQEGFAKNFEFLEKLVPRYFEGLRSLLDKEEKIGLQKLKQGPIDLTVKNVNAVKKLNEICRYDLELVAFAKRVFQERASQCSA